MIINYNFETEMMNYNVSKFLSVEICINILYDAFKKNIENDFKKNNSYKTPLHIRASVMTVAKGWSRVFRVRPGSAKSGSFGLVINTLLSGCGHPEVGQDALAAIIRLKQNAKTSN